MNFGRNESIAMSELDCQLHPSVVVMLIKSSPKPFPAGIEPTFKV